MSTTSNIGKRGRTDLELFILALVSRDIATPYELQSTAGISPGASIPALGRLDAAGYVSKGQEAARGRVAYHVTSRGKKHLESSWRALLESPDGDMDVVLRTACIALLMGQSKQVIVNYLLKASNRRTTKPEAPLFNPPGLRDPGLYPWMRQIGEPARVASEAAVLKKIASLLKKSHK